MIRKVIALLVVGLLMTPIFAEMADAGSYYYTGKAYVNSNYRYVGFTPEKITIKTNIRWSSSIFSRGFYEMMYKTLTVKLYSWSDLTNSWFVQNQKTYRNTFNNLGGVISKEFTAFAYQYYKSWWDALLGRGYVAFKIEIPKDKHFFHCNSGKTKIEVILKGEAGRYLGGFSFEHIYLTVRGTGYYWTKPTSWDKYQRYWGYSASAQEYNELMAQQTQGTLVTEPVEFDTIDVVLLSMFILGVAILSYVYISDRKRRKT